MKPETIIAMGDRLATWDEVRRATSTTSDGLLNLCRAQGNYCEMSSDLGGVIRYPTEEFEFFALLSEGDDELAN